MKFSDELGLPVTNNLRALLEEGAHKAGGVASFCEACQTPKNSYHFWTGNGKRRAEYIVWDTWERVRNVLAQLRLINPNDPRWMLPSELRDEVIRLRAIIDGSPTTISAGDGAAVANGSHASASAATQSPPLPVEERAAERLDRLASWILSSGLSPEEKLAALAIAHGND